MTDLRFPGMPADRLAERRAFSYHPTVSTAHLYPLWALDHCLATHLLILNLRVTAIRLQTFAEEFQAKRERQ
jgi:hypothetical protein